MPIETKEEAIAFVAAYRQWLYETGWAGNGAFLRANAKPSSIRAPDIVAKAHAAYALGEMHYWQMPYEQARKMHYGLPLAKWQAEREKRGMPATTNTASNGSQEARP